MPESESRPGGGGLGGQGGESWAVCRPQSSTLTETTSRPVLHKQAAGLLVAAYLLVLFAPDVRSSAYQHAVDTVVQAWGETLSFQDEVKELTS